MPSSNPSINIKNRRRTMKAKNIFKTLAFAMLMSAMPLTTACINDEIPNEIPNENGYALPVTVNVTCQSDDPATRASYNDGTGKLSFSEGDKLFVKGIEQKYGGAGPFAGTLTYVSDGKFSGTIYSEGAYSGTAADLLGSAYTSVKATLLPAGYKDYGFLTVSGEGYRAELATPDYTNVFATSKAVGVEQFSLEQASTYSEGFDLAPENSILNFTINDLAKNTKVTVSYTDDKSNEISGSVTTDGDGTATFAIGVKDGTALHYCSLTVGDNPIALTANFKTLVFGKIYNVTRSVATATGHALSSAVVGDIICSDGQAYNGLYYNYLPDDVTARAKVCYVSGVHGLALALTDEEGKMNQGTAQSTCESKTPTVPGCTWILPWLDYDMKNMITAAGGYVALRDGFSLVGGTNMRADNYWTRERDYYNSSYGLAYEFNSGGTLMTLPSNTYYVRACLSW